MAPGIGNARQRWCRFSLRQLCAVMLLCSLVCSAIACCRQKAEAKRRAVEAIEKLGGVVFYDYQVAPHGDIILGARPRAPQWLRRLLGEHFFLEVVILACYDTPFRDEHVKHVRAFRRLRRLYLSGTQISDAGVANLNELRGLEWLLLENTKITDSALQHLGTLKDLRWLDVQDTEVTAEGVALLHEVLPDCVIDYGPVCWSGESDLPSGTEPRTGKRKETTEDLRGIRMPANDLLSGNPVTKRGALARVS